MCILKIKFIKATYSLKCLAKRCLVLGHCMTTDMCYIKSNIILVYQKKYIKLINQRSSFIAVTPKVHVYAEPSPNVTENNNVTLQCLNDTSTHPTDFVWIFNKQVIAGEIHDHLSLVKVQRQQAGLYTCEVTSSAETVEDSLYLIVKCEF